MGFWRDYAEYVGKYSIAGVLAGSIASAARDAWRAPRGLTCETAVQAMRFYSSVSIRYWVLPTMLYCVVLVEEVQKIREKYEQNQQPTHSTTCGANAEEELFN